MNIVFKFDGYGSTFEDEEGNTIDFNSYIKDNFYKLDGRKGKILYIGYASVYDEHGYSGGYDEYGFIHQDDLSLRHLNWSIGKVVLEDISAG